MNLTWVESITNGINLKLNCVVYDENICVLCIKIIKSTVPQQNNEERNTKKKLASHRTLSNINFLQSLVLVTSWDDEIISVFGLCFLKRNIIRLRNPTTTLSNLFFLLILIEFVLFILCFFFRSMFYLFDSLGSLKTASYI